MTDLDRKRTYSWEKPPFPTARRRDFPPRVNISERIKELTRAERQAIFKRLKHEGPDIALLVQRFAETFGKVDLYLDPNTAHRVLAAVDEVVGETADECGQRPRVLVTRDRNEL